VRASRVQKKGLKDFGTVQNKQKKMETQEKEFKIPLRNRKGDVVDYALVDEEDFERVNKVKWCKTADGYAHGIVDGKLCYMHRILFDEIPRGQVVDHINHDRLDNRKQNLRVVTKSVNNQNKSARGVVRYIGVVPDRTNKFKAVFRNQYLGVFDDKLEAARRYDICAFLYYGKTATTNELITYEYALKYKLEDLYCKKTERELPDCVYLTKKTSTPTYNVNISTIHQHISTRYYKGGFKTIEDAERCVHAYRTEMKVKELEAKQLRQTRPIERNDQGIAVIRIKEKDVLVDDDMWYELTDMAWSITKDGYALTSRWGKTLGSQSMHRFVFGADKNVDVIDHLNRNKLDNRRSNLRSATSAQNRQNTGAKSLSGLKGVCFVEKKKPGSRQWQASITKDHKTIHIGTYASAEEAAVAYNAKALEFYGEHAFFNKIVTP
jgi:hypothetical protein